ncbi:MAG TPA: hypothetical protein PK079_13705 [Leptospiraceae bacterium]|nr:hypothetical protein [Leptospiraceae bacterium]HMX33294.1 hypothetical protein [Leptospiraceae bacterium]HMY33171.1 hypothetical protein [Leptospiraceae bacterium]HMZ66788.1 hypothetical protein [Leptospiraceae bacterium]HNA09692.1 hypothetical protein [Leptospiraceae bacterium]
MLPILMSIFLYLSIVLSISSSPIFFDIEENNSLKKRINGCSEFEKRKEFQFKEKHFDIREFDNLNKELIKTAEISAKERISQIKCIQKLNLNDKEKEDMRKGFDVYKENFLFLLEYYNRWIFSFDKSNFMTPTDRKATSEMIKLKYDLYNLLQVKTEDLLFREELLKNRDFDSFEEQLASIYLSILKGNYEYYNNISSELRKEIFRKISD